MKTSCRVSDRKWETFTSDLLDVTEPEFFCLCPQP